MAVYGQIQPPGLSCIEGSGTQIEILWSPPAVQCGPLTGYEIYYATSPDGPYTNITVDDPAVLDTTFASSDPVVYCFMQSIMDCPGQAVLNSDTLIWDLNPPVMKTVSVNDAGQIEVTWYPSASPDVAAYLIYVDGDNIPDTVFGNGSTTYIDPVSDPDTDVHDYKIAWWRNCVDDGDRRGSIGLPYNTILTQNLQQDRCARTFGFSWNRYENYNEGVTGYEIEVSLENGPWSAVDTVPGNQQIFSFQNAQTDIYYCFRVSALLPNGCKATSNTVCDTARVVQIPLGAQTRNASVLNDNNIRVEYYADTIGDIQRFNGERSLNGTSFTGWPLENEGNAGNPEYIIFKDNVSVNAQASEYWYRFMREDECNIQYFSDTVKTVLLDARIGSGLSAELEWTAYFNSNAVVTGYSIIKIMNGMSSDLITLGPGTLSYTDPDALDASSLDTVCYQIVAEADLDILSVPGTNDEQILSYSNITCLNPTPRVIFPSAFRPEGFNSIFKPIISFGTGANYNFRIYDRYGRKLFETEDTNKGWDGTDNGEIAPMNNYVYYLTFTGQDGILYEDSGNVILIR
jgi:gliding motility-associated-like protein